MLRVQNENGFLDYYTVKELCEVFDYRRATIYKYMKDGCLSYKIADGERYISIDELRKLKTTKHRGRPKNDYSERNKTSF